MSYLDKTFCASPDCSNKCQRRMTDTEKLGNIHNEPVSWAYFCGRPKNTFAGLELVNERNEENYEIEA